MPDNIDDKPPEVEPDSTECKRCDGWGCIVQGGEIIGCPECGGGGE